MFKIVNNERLSDNMFRVTFEAPLVARKAQPGQFLMFRVDEFGERMPITISSYDREAGTVSVIMQRVGSTTALLASKKAGDYVADVVGPLGNPAEFDNMHKVVVVGGGSGCAIAWPQAKEAHRLGCDVDIIAGFRTKGIVVLEDEMRACCDHLYMMTDDGTYGEKGFTTVKLKELLEKAKARRQELAKAQKARDKQYESMKLRIQALYEQGGDAAWFQMMLNSEDLSELLTRAENTQQMYEQDRKNLDKYVNTINEVNNLKTQYESDKAELEEMKASYEQQSYDLQCQIDQKKSESADYENEIAYAQQQATEYANLLAEQTAEIQRLEAERIAAEEEARRQAEEEAARQAAEEEAAAKAAEQERIIPSTMHKPYIGIIFPKRLTEGNISNSKRSDNITVSDRTYHQYFAVGIN